MDAFSVAAELLPGIELDAGQLAQIRALNQRYYIRLYDLTRPRPARPASDEQDALPARRPPTEQETGELRAMLVEDILAILTPEQRSARAAASRDGP